MKRGMTLIEVLVSLGIFTVILGASFSWIRTTTDLSSQVAEPARWRLGAESVVQLVQDALVAGDFPRLGEDEGAARVDWRDGELTIETRMEQGPRRVSVRFDEPRGRIVLVSEDAVDVLLEDVVAFDCHLVPEDDQMQVSISGAEETLARTLRW